jgi:hypothetical protein
MLVLILTSVVPVYSQLPPLPPPSISPSFASHPLADVAGDRKADLVWRHTTTGQMVVWLMGSVLKVERTM